MFLNCGLEPSTIDVIKECILWNSEARVEVDNHAYYQPVGNGTECALISFLQENDIQVNSFIRHKAGNVEA